MIRSGVFSFICLLFLSTLNGCVRWANKTEIPDWDSKPCKRIQLSFENFVLSRDAFKDLIEEVEEEFEAKVEWRVTYQERDMSLRYGDGHWREGGSAVRVTIKGEEPEVGGWGGLVFATMTLTLYPIIWKELERAFEVEVESIDRRPFRARYSHLQKNFAFILLLPATPFSYAWEAIQGGEEGYIEDAIIASIASHL